VSCTRGRCLLSVFIQCRELSRMFIQVDEFERIPNRRCQLIGQRLKRAFGIAPATLARFSVAFLTLYLIYSLPRLHHYASAHITLAQAACDKYLMFSSPSMPQPNIWSYSVSRMVVAVSRSAPGRRAMVMQTPPIDNRSANIRI